MEINVVIPNAHEDEESEPVCKKRTKLRRSFQRPKRSRGIKPRPISAPARSCGCAPTKRNQRVKIPMVTNYDIDKEYDYIMDKAFSAYKEFYDTERTKKLCAPHKAASEKHKPPHMVNERIFSLSDTNLLPSKDPVIHLRPWTALPSKFNAIKIVRDANMITPRTNRNSVLNVKTLQLSENHQRIANNAWLRKNLTNPTFNGSRSRQTVSTPTTPTLSARRAVPRRNTRPMTSRPPSAHLVSTPKLRAAYFLHHPDWPSELMHITKLSLTDRNEIPNSPVKESCSLPRRCKSAPPSQHFGGT